MLDDCYDCDESLDLEEDGFGDKLPKEGDLVISTIENPEDDIASKAERFFHPDCFDPEKV